MALAERDVWQQNLPAAIGAGGMRSWGGPTIHCNPSGACTGSPRGAVFH